MSAPSRQACLEHHCWIVRHKHTSLANCDNVMCKSWVHESMHHMGRGPCITWVHASRDMGNAASHESCIMWHEWYSRLEPCWGITPCKVCSWAVSCKKNMGTGQVRCRGFRVCDAKHATWYGHKSYSRCNDALVVMLRLWDKSVKTAVVVLSKLLVALSNNFSLPKKVLWNMRELNMIVCQQGSEESWQGYTWGYVSAPGRCGWGLHGRWGCRCPPGGCCCMRSYPSLTASTH